MNYNWFGIALIEVVMTSKFENVSHHIRHIGKSSGKGHPKKQKTKNKENSDATSKG